MKPDDSLDQRLSQLARMDLDAFRSQWLRKRAHEELRRGRGSANIERCRLEPLLLASCAAVVLARLLWFVVRVFGATV